MKDLWLGKLVHPQSKTSLHEIVYLSEKLACIKGEGEAVPEINGVSLFKTVTTNDLVIDEESVAGGYKKAVSFWVAKHKLFRSTPNPFDIKWSKEIAKKHKSIVFLEVGDAGGLFPWIIAFNNELEVFIGDSELSHLINWMAFFKKHDLIERASFALLELTNIPFRDNSIEAVSINFAEKISPVKGTIFREIFRILKRNGGLYLVDIVYEAGDIENNDNISEALKALGIARLDDLVGMLSQVGFEVSVVGVNEEFLETDKTNKVLRDLSPKTIYKKVFIEAIKK